MNAKLDSKYIIGAQYGNWTIIGEEEPVVYLRADGQKVRMRRVRARCLCGTERVLGLNNLRRGASLSCGCRMKLNRALNRLNSAIRKLPGYGYSVSDGTYRIYDSNGTQVFSSESVEEAAEFALRKEINERLREVPGESRNQ